MESPALQVLRAAGTTPPRTSVLTTKSANVPPTDPALTFCNNTAATEYPGTASGTLAFLVPIKNSLPFSNVGTAFAVARGFGT